MDLNRPRMDKSSFLKILITSLPSTLVPYANFWAGFDRPQPLADDSGVTQKHRYKFRNRWSYGFSQSWMTPAMTLLVVQSASHISLL